MAKLSGIIIFIIIVSLALAAWGGTVAILAIMDKMNKKKDNENYCVDISGGFPEMCDCQGYCVHKNEK